MGISDPAKEILRSQVLAQLRTQGFVIEGDRILPPVGEKGDLRTLHQQAVEEHRKVARPALEGREDMLVGRLAAGDEIVPEAITPRLIEVEKRTPEGLAWRWCALHWSIPVSSGYGRRLRFLVVDAAHDNKIIGLIGLGDPVYSMRARDEWIGWTADQRAESLTNVMDAFVLGAVPPYSMLLGGKLVALLATSTVVRQAFARKYGHRRTLISDRDPNARLALVTTTSALGRSSIYNRLRYSDGELAYRPLGYTIGSGDFHFSGSIYNELARLATQTGSSTALNARWRDPSKGFRNRREVVQRALRALDFDVEPMRRHGVQRQVFAAPLAKNTPGFLRGETQRPGWQARAMPHIGDWWKERWALPRAESDHDYKAFDPETWRLWNGVSD